MAVVFAILDGCRLLILAANVAESHQGRVQCMCVRLTASFHDPVVQHFILPSLAARRMKEPPVQV